MSSRCESRTSFVCPMAMSGGSTFLVDIGEQSASIFYVMKCVIKSLRKGVDLDVDCNVPQLKALIDKLSYSLNGSLRSDFNLTRSELDRVISKFPQIFSIPAVINFISLCELIKGYNILPSKDQIVEFMKSTDFLVQAGYMESVESKFESLIEIVIGKLRQNESFKINMQLCDILLLLGSTKISAAFVISRLITFFESFYFYTYSYSFVHCEIEHVELLYVILQTIIDIMQNTNSSKAHNNPEEYTRLLKILKAAKNILPNLIFWRSIDQCLSLLPLP